MPIIVNQRETRPDPGVTLMLTLVSHCCVVRWPTMALARHLLVRNSDPDALAFGPGLLFFLLLCLLVCAWRCLTCGTIRGETLGLLR